MKILMVNKFLHPNGGAETYLFGLVRGLQSRGHEVQCFGMEHEGRVVGNRANAYTRRVDFHDGSLREKLRCAAGTIYSTEARRKIRLVLEEFQPDVCHLNNFNYQLTPSILLEIQKWRTETGKPCRLLYTAHDSQLVCPNHLMRNPGTGEICTKCLGGHYINCVKGRCIHGSFTKSVLGALEGWFWNRMGVYRCLDTVIAPSRFLAGQLAANAALRDKLVVLPNFVEVPEMGIAAEKEPYVLYFGRYSKEKGIETLLRAIDQLPEIPFVFAGDGALKTEIEKRKNIVNRGFLAGKELAETIAKARFTVVPSECLENCPFSVLESLRYGTPVLGADIGGIPELIRVGETGELFASGNAAQLAQKLRRLWQAEAAISAYTKNCGTPDFQSLPQYCAALERLYCPPGKGERPWSYT